MADAAETSEEINVDELLSSTEAPSPERPMTGGEEPTPEPAAPTWDGKQWEFDWNGKKVMPDSQDKAKTWMSQGYNYSQRMGELNKTQAQLKASHDQAMAELKRQQEGWSPYRKVDEYARQNPQWWQHVLQQFDQQQRQGQGIDPSLAQVIKPLEEKLGKFEQYFGQLEQQQQAEQLKREDQALDQEVGEIRKQYPNIDLGSPDPATGESLELRVLKHAQSIGTSSFRAAFRDYLHDKLIEQSKASGREAIAKDAQVNAKKGILGKTPAPTKGLQPAGNVRGKSYDQLAKEALAEFGIS